MAYFPFANAAEQKIDDNSFRYVLIHDGSMMAVRMRFLNAQDGPVSTHTHPHEQITYILKGSFRFVVDGEERVVGAGDSCHFASESPHGGIPLEDGCELLDVFTPIREDFLV